MLESFCHKVVSDYRLYDLVQRAAGAGQVRDRLRPMLRGAENHSYDGVIVMATQGMLSELHRVAVPDVKKRLMAEIARPSSEGYAMPVGFENYVADMPTLGGMQ